MDKRSVLNRGGVIPTITYAIQLVKDYEMIKVNKDITLEEAKKKYPDRVEKLPKGKILWQQECIFDLEQVLEVKREGFHYQWGAFTAYEKIPMEYLSFVKIEQYVF